MQQSNWQLLPIDCAAGPLESSGSGQLQKDQRWDASHYGNLEQFIYDYLVGGASAGETVRLKLQTPLFVADALLQAAQRQLVEELQTASQVRLHSDRSDASPLPFPPLPSPPLPPPLPSLLS